MKQDYLKQVLPPQRPPVTAAELPGAAELRAAEREADAVHGSLDMLRFTDREREGIGPVAAPGELELDRLFAELSDRCPTLLSLIGRPAGAVRHGYDLGGALSVYREANQAYLRAVRGVLLISGAALTQDNDAAEEAARALSADPAIPADRQVVIGSAVASLDSLRGRLMRTAQTRQQRRSQRRARAQAALGRVKQRGEQVRRLTQLARAPLPEPRED